MQKHKILSILAIIVALVYIIMPYDLDHCHKFLGYIDDFFFFMAAFIFVHASFNKKANHATRHTLHQLSLACVILGGLSLFLLAVMF